VGLLQPHAVAHACFCWHTSQLTRVADATGLTGHAGLPPATCHRYKKSIGAEIDPVDKAKAEQLLAQGVALFDDGRLQESITKFDQVCGGCLAGGGRRLTAGGGMCSCAAVQATSWSHALAGCTQVHCREAMQLSMVRLC
jgi:hypothetical protein